MRTRAVTLRIVTTLGVAAALCLGASATAAAATDQAVPTKKACEVVDVVGMSAQAARTLLKGNGCTNVVTRMCATDSKKFGVVFKQTPKPRVKPYPSGTLVTLWRVVRPATGVATCGGGQSAATDTYDGLYTYTASKGSRTCTTTYTTGQGPKSTSYGDTPFPAGTPGFMIVKGVFTAAGILEGTVNADGVAQVVPNWGYPFLDPPGKVQFTETQSGRIQATGLFQAANLLLEETTTSRTVCDVKYWFTADRTDGPDS